jgi:hypothetical protein
LQGAQEGAKAWDRSVYERFGCGNAEGGPAISSGLTRPKRKYGVQALRRLRKNLLEAWVLKEHDFSRADKANSLNKLQRRKYTMRVFISTLETLSIWRSASVKRLNSGLFAVFSIFLRS